MKNINNLSFPKSVIGNLNLRKKAEWILKQVQDDVVEVPDSNIRVRQYNDTTQTPDKSSPGWNKAFTLIELLVVVLIIGILSTIALPQYQKAVEKSRATEGVIVVRAWYDALQRYYLANGSYPTTLASAISDIDITLPTLRYGVLHYYYADSSTDNTVYVAVKNTKEGYILSRTLRGSSAWVARGLTCGVDGDSATGTKICKSLCGTNNLIQIFGSPMLGCAIQ